MRLADDKEVVIEVEVLDDALVGEKRGEMHARHMSHRTVVAEEREWVCGMHGAKDGRSSGRHVRQE